MYIIVWKKYLPVIKLLMKKAVVSDQQLGLNKTDFEKDKVPRKGNARFTFRIVNGIAQNSGAITPIARELVAVLLEDSSVMELLQQQEFTFSLNSRYELFIHLEPKGSGVTSGNETPAEAEALPEQPAVVA